MHVPAVSDQLMPRKMNQGKHDNRAQAGRAEERSEEERRRREHTYKREQKRNEGGDRIPCRSGDTIDVVGAVL